MNESYHRLSREALLERLEALQAELDQEHRRGGAAALLHELQVHQIELEMQNRDLGEAQAALEQSRDRFAELYDFAPVAYLSLDAKGLIREANLTAAGLLGRERARLIDQPMISFVHPSCRGGLFSHLTQTLASDRRVGTEIELQTRTETRLPVRLESVSSHHEGEELAWTAVLDLREAKRAERALRDNRNQLQAIVDTAVEGIVTIDTRATILSFNPAAERMFGYAAEEVLGRNVSMLMPAPYREQHDGYVARYLRTREPRIIGIGREVEGCRRDGSTFPLELSVAEAPDDRPRFVGMLRDISARKAAESALRESEERFRQLAENIDEVFWIADIEGLRTLYVSPAFETVWGRPRESAYGHRGAWLEHVDPEDRDGVARALAALPHSHTLDIEYRIRRPDGSERWIHDRGFPVRDERGEVYRIAGIANDVTTDKRLRATQDELAHITRVNLAGELASGLAHELNQPLSAIVTYGQLGQQKLARPDGRSAGLGDLLDKIVQQALRAAEIIAHLRRLVGKKPPRREPTDINALLKDTLRLVRSELDRAGVRVRLQLAAAMPPIECDRSQIQHVVLNLVYNAVDAMGETAPARRELCTWTAPMGGGLAAVEVAVADAGPGVPEGDLERLFRPFYSTKEHGMGMGLAISRSIVESHGGHMWASRNPDGGLTFHFTIDPRGAAEHGSDGDEG